MVLTEEANKHGWRFGAELGLWDGRTLFYLLENVPGLKMIGVDAFRDIGVPEYSTNWNHAGDFRQVMKQAKGYPGRLVLLKMLTVRAAHFIKDQSLDFVFVDADHSSCGVDADIHAWEGKIRPGGFMAGHDIDWPSVRSIVGVYFPNYETRKDNVWITQLP